MKAIILAAGQGTRLKKYTENLPKGMLNFKGKTIIERQIDLFNKCGIDKIICIRGFAADKINYDNIKYYTNDEYETTNMVVSFLCAKEEFDDDIIVSYSDILFEEELLKGMIFSEVDFGVAVDDDWKRYWQKRYGTIDYDIESLSIDKNNNIVELGLKNPPLEKIDARYIGLIKFSKNGLEKVCEIMEDAFKNCDEKPWQQSGKTPKKAYMTDLLNAIIESGEEVKAIRFNGGWIEFDTNEDYENILKWDEEGELENTICIV